MVKGYFTLSNGTTALTSVDVGATVQYVLTIPGTFNFTVPFTFNYVFVIDGVPIIAPKTLGFNAGQYINPTIKPNCTALPAAFNAASPAPKVLGIVFSVGPSLLPPLESMQIPFTGNTLPGWQVPAMPALPSPFDSTAAKQVLNGQQVAATGLGAWGTYNSDLQQNFDSNFGVEVVLKNPSPYIMWQGIHMSRAYLAGDQFLMRSLIRNIAGAGIRFGFGLKTQSGALIRGVDSPLLVSTDYAWVDKVCVITADDLAKGLASITAYISTTNAVGSSSAVKECWCLMMPSTDLPVPVPVVSKVTKRIKFNLQTLYPGQALTELDPNGPVIQGIVSAVNNTIGGTNGWRISALSVAGAVGSTSASVIVDTEAVAAPAAASGVVGISIAAVAGIVADIILPILIVLGIVFIGWLAYNVVTNEIEAQKIGDVSKTEQALLAHKTEVEKKLIDAHSDGKLSDVQLQTGIDTLEKGDIPGYFNAIKQISTPPDTGGVVGGLFGKDAVMVLVVGALLIAGLMFSRKS